MRSVARFFHESLRKEKTSLVLFLAFNVFLVFATASLSDPTILYIVTALVLLTSIFLLQVKNFIECLLLLLMVFSIDIVVNNSGTWGVAGIVGLLLILAILRSLAEGSGDWQHSILKKELLMFIGVVFASLFWGTPAFTGYRLFSINLFLGFIVFLITHFTISSYKSLSYLTLWLIFLLSLNALYAIYFHLRFGFRALSLFVDTPTYSGHYFVQGFALAVGAYFCPPFQKMRMALLLAMGVLLVALFLTLTRAAWLAFFFLILLSLLFSKIPKRYLVYGILGFGLTIVAVFFLFSTQTFGIMLKSRLATDIQSAGQSVGSIAFRILLWQSAWNIFLNNPILGVGFDNFVVVNASTPNFPIVRALGGMDLYVHNIYLEVLAETGIIGFIFLLLLIIAIYNRLGSMLKLMEQHRYRFLLLGYAGVLSLWLFMGLSEAALYTPVTAVFFFFILGIISGFHKLLVREEPFIASAT